MKNWKTTIAGFAVGFPGLVDALIDAFTSGYFTDKSGWQLAASIAFIVLGAVLKDKPSQDTQRLGGSQIPPKKDEK